MCGDPTRDSTSSNPQRRSKRSSFFRGSTSSTLSLPWRDGASLRRLSLRTSRADPFVSFEGGPGLTWDNICLTVNKHSPDKSEKRILADVSGEARTGELAVLMGASGSGKTSLLSILAGVTVSTKKTPVTGTIKLGDDVVDPTSKEYQSMLAYLSQNDDDLMPSSTPRESIAFSARCRLPASVSDQEIQRHTEKILTEMDLLSVADNYIGGERIRGLSGGEKRRVSLALALVVRPSIICSDEVTSGLDTHTATKVLRLLKKVARSGAAVLTSIHQPTSAMFKDVDYVTLIRKGRVMFKGRPSDVGDYFEQRQLPVPLHYNPADWMLEVSQSHETEALEERGFYTNFLERPPAESTGTHIPSIYETASKKDRLKVYQEVWELSKRESRNLYRDKVVLAIRIFVLVGGSCMMILAMAGVAENSLESVEAFSTHVGAVFLALFVTFSPVLFILVEFPDKRRVFINEFRMNYFRMSSYMIHAFLFEVLTMILNVLVYLTPTYFGLGFQARYLNLSAVFWSYASCSAAIALLIASTLPNAEQATDIFPLTLLPQLLFCGFFISLDGGVPSWTAWLQWLQPLTYGFRLFLMEEFRECERNAEENSDLAYCFTQFSSAASEVDGGDVSEVVIESGFNTLYNDSSQLFVAATGAYEGGDDILEYLEGTFVKGEPDYSSFLNNDCQVKGLFKIVNAQAQGTSCSFSVANIRTGQVPASVVAEGFEDTRFVRFVIGYKFFLDLSVENSPIIYELRIFFTDDAIENLLACYSPSKTVDSVCDSFKNSCPDHFISDGFANHSQCVAGFEELPMYKANAVGLHTIESNSTGCRFLHTLYAQRKPEMHCPHVSLAPDLDQLGRNKCGKSKDKANEDYFTKDEIDAFNAYASENGVQASGECEATESGRQLGYECVGMASGITDAFLESEYRDVVRLDACYDYLVEQNALSDQAGLYWGCLLALYIFLRLCAFLQLRLRSKQYMNLFEGSFGDRVKTSLSLKRHRSSKSSLAITR